VGAGYSPTEDLTIDVAYSYLQEEDVKVSDANALGQSYNAKYENSANGFGVGMTYRF
jgi:long-chain fatty acid transport protein